MLTLKGHAQTPVKQSPLKESYTYWKSRFHQGLFQKKSERMRKLSTDCGLLCIKWQGETRLPNPHQLPESQWQDKDQQPGVHQDQGHQDSTLRKFWKTQAIGKCLMRNWNKSSYQQEQPIIRTLCTLTESAGAFTRLKQSEEIWWKSQTTEQIFGRVKLIKSKAFVIKHHSLTEQLEGTCDASQGV